MKKLYVFLFTVCLALFLSACSSDTDSASKGGEGENETTDEVQKAKEEDKNTEIEKPDSYETETLEYKDDGDVVTITYPVFSYPELDSVLKDKIDSKFKEFKERLREGREFIEGDEFDPELEFTYDFEEPVITDDFISIPFHEYAYEGGAHGMKQMLPFNFDLNNNRVLELTDVLGKHDTDLEMLANVINTKLTSGEIPDAGDNWTGSDEGLEVMEDNFKYFSLTEDSIIIYFQPYELASFAAGIIDVEIKWDELRHQRK